MGLVMVFRLAWSNEGIKCCGEENEGSAALAPKTRNETHSANERVLLETPKNDYYFIRPQLLFFVGIKDNTSIIACLSLPGVIALRCE